MSLRIMMLSVAWAATATSMAAEDVVYLRVISQMCDFGAVRYSVVPSNSGAVVVVPRVDVAGLEKLAGPDASRCYVVRTTGRDVPARYEVHVRRAKAR